MSNVSQPTAGRRRRHRLVAVPFAALAVAVSACAPMNPPPPSPGLDLAIGVAAGRAVVGQAATHSVTVSNVGLQPSAGEIAVSIVAPPGQSITTAAGTDWSCDLAGGGASSTCTTAAVAAASSALPVIQVTTSVSGTLGATSIYAVVSVPGDTNPANDTGRGESRIVPAFGGDQLYVQLAGALNLRSGGNISGGSVTITRDNLGFPQTLVIDATVGTTSVEADLTRNVLNQYSGPITITDPAVQGGDPLTVNWFGLMNSIGAAPWQELSGFQLGLRIPTLDLPGISGAALNGVEFSLGITAGDFDPDPPAPSNQPALTYADPGGAQWIPTLEIPNRVVNGAEFDLGVNLIASSGGANGPVSADIDLPAGVEFVGAGSGTTCTEVPAIPGRYRCVLNASINNPVAANIVGRLLGAFLPTGFPSINVRVRPTVDFQDLTISAGVDSANSAVGRVSATINPRPPGPDVGLAMTGPERTADLWLAEGTNLGQNRYQFAVDNAGTATSAGGVSVELALPTGVTFRGFSNGALNSIGNNRFLCSAAGQVVTCTRNNGIPATSLLSPAPTFTVTVDVDASAAPTATAIAAVSNSNDVDPGGPAKSGASIARVATTAAAQFSASLSNGAFNQTGRPVLDGGFAFDVSGNGRLDGISGCATSRDFQQEVLLVPVVGPTLVPAQFSDHRLCINATRVLGTNQWVGTSSLDFVAGPVFVPELGPIPPLPIDFPLLQPRPVTAAAATLSAPTLGLDGTLSGSASGANPSLALNGGASYQLQWNLGVVPGVTCVDNTLCP